jgi:hypothetical protein
MDYEEKWIRVHDVDIGHIEMCDNFSEVLNDWDIDVEYQQDKEGSLYVTINKRESNETSI